MHAGRPTFDRIHDLIDYVNDLERVASGTDPHARMAAALELTMIRNVIGRLMGQEPVPTLVADAQAELLSHVRRHIIHVAESGLSYETRAWTKTYERLDALLMRCEEPTHRDAAARF